MINLRKLYSSQEIIDAESRVQASAIRSWARRLRRAAKRAGATDAIEVSGYDRTQAWIEVESVVREMCDVAIGLVPPEGDAP